MEKIGRIRKRLGNFKNVLHLFFRHCPLAAAVAEKKNQNDKECAG